MILETPQQILIPQNTMKLFTQSQNNCFDGFVEVWRNNNSSNLHNFSSPRSLLFGPCQTAYSTFIGFCHPSKDEVEREGGVFGLFLTYSTQPHSPPFPIFISTKEFNWIKDISKISNESLSIFHTFLRKKSFCFIPIETSIFTPFINTPSPVVIDTKLFSNHVFQTTREITEKKRFVSKDFTEQIDEIENFYQNVMNEIKESSALPT